jgi:hypothetical protein
MAIVTTVKVHIAGLPNDVAASPIEFKDTFFAGCRLRSRVSDVWMSQNPPGFGFFTFHGDLTELDELLLFCEGKAFGSCTPRLSQATRQVFTGEKTLVRKQLQAQQMLGYPLAPVPPLYAPPLPLPLPMPMSIQMQPHAVLPVPVLRKRSRDESRSHHSRGRGRRRRSRQKSRRKSRSKRRETTKDKKSHKLRRKKSSDRKDK